MTLSPRYHPKYFLAKLITLPAQSRVFGLDLMRAIAILFVVIAHAQLILPANVQWPVGGILGVWGVDIFFALSGFLIGSILLSLAPRFDSIHILPYFWQRRWFRTIPNYLLFLLLHIALVIFFFKSKDIPNLFLYLTFTQSWMWRHPALFAVAWSLAIEEWFYLLFPISLFLIHRLSKSFTIALLVSAAIFIIIPTLARIYLAVTPEYASWSGSIDFQKITFLRLDAIIYGVLAAWAKKKFPTTWVKLRFVLLIIGSVLVFFSWSFAIQQGLNSSFFAKTFLFSALPFGFACIIPAFDHWEISKENLISHSVRLIALWSYSLYLCNLVLAQSLASIENRVGKHPLILDVAFFVLFFIICFVISSGVYTYFEKPITDLRERFTRT